MRLAAPAPFLALIALAAQAQPAEPATGPAGGLADDIAALHGTVEGELYISPTGTFKVPIPVLPALGGGITDTANVVTFEDEFTTHISIAAFPQDATQRWQLSVLGTKDYLQYYLDNFFLPDFKRAFPQTQLEKSGHFISNFDGALIAYTLLPGGSMFSSRIPRMLDTDKPPVAKRGNMFFVKNGTVFVITTELAERVTEGSTYNLTAAQENDLLKERLIDIGNKIRFLKPVSAN
ncbi:MAG: hypothetical protein ABSA05_02600 [Opitutaceae bacterium]|jgi:hypothetical protein